MNSFLQYLLVGIIVAAAAFYAVWNLIGPSLRLRWASAALRIVPAAGGSNRFLQRVVMRQNQRLQGSGCGSCKAASDTVKR